ncbi:MAG TPA: DegT/DnrJ/EryC1/StrS family aminotransferase [Caulobacteraceae bacterium]|jgi:dTDP-4-amino-4,6-dideoxygalactose transaminase|nr:DegT/DnrJ/EryC1/StrS family aminotransferase [Caulobacteraceae bacterium]
MIPFLDLKWQHAELGPQLMRAAERVIGRAQFTLGPETEAFEASLAEFCGSPHAVAVNSGTSALHLALLAAGVGPGDEVITCPATFVATIAAIQYIGAVPRLVDIDPLAWTLDPARIEAAMSPRTRAILPVHLHGRMADMKAITDIAEAHGVAVIEDAAQALGARADGVRAGAHGDLGCFSFYPGKNLGACGEGGAVVTRRSDFAERLRRLRDWGQSRKYLHAEKGFNYRMDELQAAFLSVKLPHLERWNQARRAAAARYDRLLAGLGVAHPESAGDGRHVYHVYGVRVADRDAVRGRLAGNVATNAHYPIPVHLQPAFADLGYRLGDFPVAETFCDETLSLPMFPGIADDEVDAVCERLAEAIHCPPVVTGEAA